MARKSDPDTPIRLPGWLGPTSNGEYLPRAATTTDRARLSLLRRVSDQIAPRLGMTRRTFLESAQGTAAALLVTNFLAGCSDPPNGDPGPADAADLLTDANLADATSSADAAYQVDTSTVCDPQKARKLLNGDEFVLDVQTHFVDIATEAPWIAANPQLKGLLNYFGAGRSGCTSKDFRCFSQEAWLREVFVESDTSFAVLSAVPSPLDKAPLSNASIAKQRDIVSLLAGSERLATHALVLPDLGEAGLDAMDKADADLKPAGWKVYTPWTPAGGGWFLDDPKIGTPFLERVRKTSTRMVCCHKGFALPGFSAKHADPRDIGPAAKLFDDITFVVYHSGFSSGGTEGPYAATGTPTGVDRLIRSLKTSGIQPNSNVYAELGGTWQNLITRPTEAAHVIGKLLLHVGAKRVVWGTDSIWFGSPQSQLQAFRAFKIPAELQAKHGYPELTDKVKADILGRNAAPLYGVDPDADRCSLRADWLDQLKKTAAVTPRLPPVIGPSTRREFMLHWRSMLA